MQHRCLLTCLSALLQATATPALSYHAHTGPPAAKAAELPMEIIRADKLDTDGPGPGASMKQTKPGCSTGAS